MSDELCIGGGDSAQAVTESSYDTLVWEKHRNFLLNSAGLGIYAHGRIHQQSQNAVFVSDLIHQRGHKQTRDILLMESAAVLAGGEPLTVRSALGNLVAMAILPAMDTANGEGDLVAYYEGGVVTFNTHEAPRMSVADTEGKIVLRGWDQKRLKDYRLNRISAVGRYAVCVLPRDHYFRSLFGLHLLRSVLGEGSYKTEQLNRISAKVDGLLKLDPPELLGGAICGFWLHGNRMLASTGMIESPCHSVTSFGRGFVSWNQEVTVTEDGTPIPVWEGLWTFDHAVKGAHWAGEVGVRPEAGAFGFIVSGTDEALYFASIGGTLHDYRDDDPIEIEWSAETGQFHMGSLQVTKSLRDGTFEYEALAAARIRVLVRSDQHGEWVLWSEFKAEPDAGRTILKTEELGSPPRSVTEGTWFQIRLEGTGPVELRSIDLEFAAGLNKSGRRGVYVSGFPEKDPFETNNSPASTRWAP